MSDGATVVPFGKYKGRPFTEVMQRDPQYVQWLTGQPWFVERFGHLINVTVNQFGPPEQETPEHNALQLRFLDETFRIGLLASCSGTRRDLLGARRKVAQRIVKVVRATRTKRDAFQFDAGYGDDREKAQRSARFFAFQSARASLKDAIPNRHDFLKAWLEAAKTNPFRETSDSRYLDANGERTSYNRTSYSTFDQREAELLDVLGLLRKPLTPYAGAPKFEVGADVLFTAGYRPGSPVTQLPYSQYAKFHTVDLSYTTEWNWCVECKPTLGDDFPAVLRQIQAQRDRSQLSNSSSCVGGFAYWVLLYDRFTASAPLDQVTAFFRSRGISVRSVAEVEAAFAKLGIG